MTTRVTKHILSILLAGIGMFCLHGTSFGQDYELFEAPFNSKEADFSGVYLGKDVVFCSTRSKKMVSFSEDSLSSFYTDLYIARSKGDGQFHNAEPLKGKVNTLFNEGHATFNSSRTVMYYTGNLKTTQNTKSKTEDYLLGIFIAELIGGEWVPKGSFEYNSPNGKYSVAHPCLSQDDKTLYFSSNMPGGKGGSDIYRCRYENGSWTIPENIGSQVNTRGNEFFPFINDSDELYFSTDSRNDSEGMDIYKAELEGSTISRVYRLNNSINSEFDDFAYYEMAGKNGGIFSSNRYDNQDDLFFFKKYSKDSKYCQENPTRQRCYEIKDLLLSDLSGKPFVYFWDLGDGNTYTGNIATHCYEKPGDYHISLSILDTLTRQQFMKISDTDVHIDPVNQPYIHSTDTVYQSKAFQVKLDRSEFNDFEIKEIVWSTEDKKLGTGEEINVILGTIGLHQIKCTLIGKKKTNGIQPRMCIYKDVMVTDEPKFATEEEPVDCCKPIAPITIYMKRKKLLENNLNDSLSAISYLVVAKTETPLSFSNKKFKNIKSEIKEYSSEKGYYYVANESSNWHEMLISYSTLKAAQVEDLSILDSGPETENWTLTRRGIYQEEESTKTLPIVATKTVMEATEDYSILLFTSDFEVPVTDPRLTNLSTDVYVLKNGNTISYFAYRSANKTTLSKQLNQLKLNGYKEARIQQLPIDFDRQTKVIKTKANSLYYQVIVAESSERIPFNNDALRNCKESITEIYKEPSYKYVVNNTKDKDKALETLRIYKAQGNEMAYLDSSTLFDFNASIIKTGKFIGSKNADQLNIEFSKLSDIKFEYDSHEILEESFKNLNYIAAILKLEEDFTLKINAHTCNIGGSEYNQQLSELRAQSVVEYFVTKGISKERLKAKGFGMSQPLLPNNSEKGRASNRRVEFTIVFELKNN